MRVLDVFLTQQTTTCSGSTVLQRVRGGQTFLGHCHRKLGIFLGELVEPIKPLI